MIFWNGQGTLNAAWENEIFSVDDRNPLPFKPRYFTELFGSVCIVEQIERGVLDASKIKRKLQPIVPTDNIEELMNATSLEEEAAKLRTKVNDLKKQIEIVDTLSKVNPYTFLKKGLSRKHAIEHISTLSKKILPFLNEVLNLEQEKYRQVEQFFNPGLTPFHLSIDRRGPPHSHSVLERNAPLEVTQAAKYVIACCKLVSETRKSLFELFASEIPTKAAEIYGEFIQLAQAEPGTLDFYNFCRLLMQHFDPSYNGNCEHNALATLNWIKVSKNGKPFNELTLEERLDFILRVLFSNDSIESHYIEIGETPNPLQKHLTAATKGTLKAMLAYLTISSTNRYGKRLQAHYKPSTSLPSHTLRDALDIIYANEGLIVVLGIKMLTTPMCATVDTSLVAERVPLVCAEEMMVFRVQNGQLEFSGPLSGQRGSLSKEGGIYIQATACDKAVECEGIFREPVQALRDGHYDTYKEWIRNNLREILQFYAGLYDTQNFEGNSSRVEVDNMFHIFTEELKKPRANLPIAVRHITAAIPGGIRHLYFRNPGELAKVSPVIRLNRFPEVSIPNN